MAAKTNSSSSKKWLIPLIAVGVVALLAIGLLVFKANFQAQWEQVFGTPSQTETTASGLPQQVIPSPSLQAPSASASPEISPSPGAVSAGKVDLTVDKVGLSNATAVIRTEKGIIKFKFYTNDAPNTVNRFVELIQQHFYDGLAFHRVVPDFVIQGGDPTGTGAGGSGKKLKSEFNNRRHIEGTVAMARTQDPDSADSQFYISLGVHPNLDQHYTVFGQVISGMDVARKITKGDRMLSITLE